MARPTLFSHPKFRRLVHDLGLPKAHVLGHLEFLWQVGYESGDAVIGDATDVELAAEWTGEAGQLCNALVRVRLLDVIDERFVIHDLHDHAPRYVKDRWYKEQQRKGLRAADKRRTRGGRAADKRRRVGEKSATPAPAPAPTLRSTESSAKNAELSPSPPAAARMRPCSTRRVAFEAFWTLYPRRIGKGAAERVWERLRVDEALWCRMGAAIAHQRQSRQWQRDGGQYVPHPATWLRQKRWEDEPDTGGRDPTEAAWAEVDERLAARGIP